MKRPPDEFFKPKVKVLNKKMEEYINELELQRRCPFPRITCIYREGTSYRCSDITVCPGNGDSYCDQLYQLKDMCKDILKLLGNVDHSIGNGSRSAKTRGDLLNDIRKMLNEYMPKELSPEDEVEY